MKKLYLVPLLVLFAVLLGCSGGNGISDVNSKVLVTIERSVIAKRDPSLDIAAENAYVKNDTVVIEGLISIKGDNGWAVERMEIEDNKLIIPIPKNPLYRVTITKKD